MSRELLQQALNVLEFNFPVIEDFGSKEQLTDCHRAITKLYAELAKPEQEPVAYKYTDKTNPLVFYFTELKGKDVTQNLDVIETALYTAPLCKEWVGLHLDDIPETYAGDKSFLNIARWAEAKLKEKNNAHT
jgi:hypothetical protein